MPRVLFLCAENSCRSQMAEGLMRQLSGSEYEVHSAGTRATSVNRRAIKVMAEAGADISSQHSKAMSEYNDQLFDLVITVCGDSPGSSCPTFSGSAKRRFHWPFDDPGAAGGSEEEILGEFRRVRDEIKNKLEQFVRAELSPE